jgi:hypothetical protein
MRKILMTTLVAMSVLALGGMSTAQSREPLFPRLRAVFARPTCATASNVASAQPVREFLQSQPIRSAVANTFETVGGTVIQAGQVLRPTCSNGTCPR